MLREFAGLLKRLSAVAGVVSLFAFAGQANAVSYVGKWDPQLPDPFSSYRWEGSVLFSLPCLSAGNTFTGTKNGANCSGLSLTSGTVQFFDTHGTLTLGDDTLVETLNFNPVALSFLTSVTLLNGTPTGVVGDFKTYLQSSIFADGVDSNNGTATEWDLSFNGLPVLKWKYQVCEVDDDACHFAVAVREFEECETIKGSTPTRGPGAPTWTSFATVPEPGSLALLLPALSALAFVRRRKNSTEGGALV